MKTSDGIPPRNARRIYRWADLPSASKPAQYRVTDPGQEPRVITVSRRKRQVLEGLMQAPIFAASYCRLSDNVLPLRRDHGVDIACTIYNNDADTGRDRYGIYTLVSKVERIDGGAL
ncbi:MAG: hypothetical protein Gyms2KO_20500 [Gymnodinialimonas sp.]